MYAGPGTAASRTHSPNIPVFQETTSITRWTLESRMPVQTTSTCCVRWQLAVPVAFQSNTRAPSFSNPACCQDPPAPYTTLVFGPVVASRFLFGMNGCAHDAFQEPPQHHAEQTGDQCARRDAVSDHCARRVSVRTSAFQMSPKTSVSSTLSLFAGLSAVHPLEPLLMQLRV